MRTKGYMVVFGLLFLVSLNEQHYLSPQNLQGCDRFRVGKFRIDSELDSTYWIIERTDSTQIETNALSGMTQTLKIRWTGPCEYELTLLNLTEKPKDSLIARMQKIPLKTKIIQTGKDYYIFESYKEGIEFIFSDTLRLIE